MRVLTALVCGFVFLAGCSSLPPVKERSDLKLCRSAKVGWLVGLADYNRDEMISRGLIEMSEWALIVDSQVKVGMTECGILASTYGGDSPYRALKEPYKLGGDNTLIISAFDPTARPASYNNWYRYKPKNSPVEYEGYVLDRQAYVAKYLVTLKEGKVVGCKSVDFDKAVITPDFASIDISKIGKTEDLSELFPLPCMKNVPGFKSDKQNLAF